jgi:uncharacterized membrane protein YfcA
MDLLAAISPLLVVSGFIVGMLVGLTGVGGGSLMTPILVLLFGVHATTAVGLAANEMEFFGAGSRKLGSHETPRWRKRDSNPRSRTRRYRFECRN